MSTQNRVLSYSLAIFSAGVVVIVSAFAFALWQTDSTVAQDESPAQAISLRVYPEADALMHLLAQKQSLEPAQGQSSAWDLYLEGDTTQLTENQKKGALLFFVDANCASCHSGSEFTEEEYHNLGVPQREEETFVNLGRFNETGQHGDMMAFKTKPLRNVAKTAPYMHNDVLPTLESAIRQHMTSEAMNTQPYIENAFWMVREPAVREQLSDTEVQYLVEFLYALSSE